MALVRVREQLELVALAIPAGDAADADLVSAGLQEGYLPESPYRRVRPAKVKGNDEREIGDPLRRYAQIVLQLGQEV